MTYDDDANSGTTNVLTNPDQYTVNKYGLGARGIDSISRYYGTPSSFSLQEVSYPVYDGHGNMVLTIRRDGSSFTTHDERRYDVWGSVRAGSGASSQRYCANLGHQQDDESGLVYMRARYYEPGSGRFIAEDPARDGLNWFAYCGNDPSNCVDPTGKHTLGLFLSLIFLGYNIAKHAPTLALALATFENEYAGAFIDTFTAANELGLKHQAAADAAFASGNIRAGEYENGQAAINFGEAKLIQIIGPWMRRMYIEFLRLDFLMGDDRFGY